MCAQKIVISSKTVAHCLIPARVSVNSNILHINTIWLVKKTRFDWVQGGTTRGEA